MLTAYLKQTARLLQNPAAPTSLYSPADLTDWINIARGQLAGETECIRIQGTLTLSNGTQVYPFSAIAFAVASNVSGIQGPINVRQALIVQGSGQVWIEPREFEWFTLYYLNNAAPTRRQPTVWSQYGQGVKGTLYFADVPDASYTANLDCVGYPIALTDDTTVEAIPYLWTDAVPFFAAYYALLSAQSAQRQADADRMLQRYKEFIGRARQAATPSVLPYQYPQQANPVRGNQLGQQQSGGGG